MEIIISADNGIRTVKIEGELNIYSASLIKKGLIAELRSGSGLEIDLSGVSEMDTSGLQLLLLAWREAEKADKPFRIVSASQAAQNIIRLYNMVELFSETKECA